MTEILIPGMREYQSTELKKLSEQIRDRIDILTYLDDVGHVISLENKRSVLCRFPILCANTFFMTAKIIGINLKRPSDSICLTYTTVYLRNFDKLEQLSKKEVILKDSKDIRWQLYVGQSQCMIYFKVWTSCDTSWSIYYKSGTN